ncbi:MAG: hypothetical protein DRI46_08095 [Chloroflexi bacterium]|nr:MAG: hypothetical protein DRI46_08095 [Chloroflexota bacterium]
MAQPKDITQFQIVAGPTIDEFVSSVNEALEDGWQPYGEVHVTAPNRHADYRSKFNILGMAMVKYHPA